MPNHDSLAPLFGEPIRGYSRHQAIEDGVLVDVSAAARDAGFTIPVALTAAAWADCVAWTEDDSQRKGGCPQDQSSRLGDVLGMLRLAIALSPQAGDALRYQLHRVPSQGSSTSPEVVTLKSLCGPGDEGQPVITLLLPHED